MAPSMDIQSFEGMIFANYVCINRQRSKVNLMLLEMEGPTIEGKKEILHQSRKLSIKIIKTLLKTVLLLGFLHNYKGFLLKESKWIVQVNQNVVKMEMNYLQDHSIITWFVGDKLFHLAFNTWVTFLNQRMMGGKALFDHSFGRGFFMFKIDGSKYYQKVLMLIPFRSSQGMCVFKVGT